MPEPPEHFQARILAKSPHELTDSLTVRKQLVDKRPELLPEIKMLEGRKAELDRLENKKTVQDVRGSIKYREQRMQELGDSKNSRDQLQAIALKTELMVLKDTLRLREFEERIEIKTIPELQRSVNDRNEALGRNPSLQEKILLGKERNLGLARLKELDRLTHKPSLPDVNGSIKSREKKLETLKPEDYRTRHRLTQELGVLYNRRLELQNTPPSIDAEKLTKKIQDIMITQVTQERAKRFIGSDDAQTIINTTLKRIEAVQAMTNADPLKKEALRSILMERLNQVGEHLSVLEELKDTTDPITLKQRRSTATDYQFQYLESASKRMYMQQEIMDLGNGEKLFMLGITMDNSSKDTWKAVCFAIGQPISKQKQEKAEGTSADDFKKAFEGFGGMGENIKKRLVVSHASGIEMARVLLTQSPIAEHTRDFAQTKLEAQLESEKYAGREHDAYFQYARQALLILRRDVGLSPIGICRMLGLPESKYQEINEAVTNIFDYNSTIDYGKIGQELKALLAKKTNAPINDITTWENFIQ